MARLSRVLDRPLASQSTMGLQSIERRLERMVDGVFTRRTRGSIRPIELGRRLVREMDDNRSVDVKGRRIVPNDFTIALSAGDRESFERHRDHAHHRTRRGRQGVRPRGGLQLHGPGRRAPQHRRQPEERSVHRDLPAQAGRGRIVDGLDRAPVRATHQPQPGHRLRRAASRSAPSRSTTATSADSTPRCARAAGGYVVVDLNSTNGTLVNGVRISGEQRLNDGDIISFGSTHVRFEAS